MINDQPRSRSKAIPLRWVPEVSDLPESPPAHCRTSNDHDAHPDTVHLRDEIAGLQTAMQSQAVIEQAKGILMGRFGVDHAIAFSILRRWSMTANLKVRDLALALVEITANNTTAFTADTRALAAMRAELDAATATASASQIPDGNPRG